jgi:hypothetical protein
MTQNQVPALIAILKEFQLTNPDIKWDIYSESELPETSEETLKDTVQEPTLQEVMDELASLRRLLDRIFGNHILMKGRWKTL